MGDKYTGPERRESVRLERIIPAEYNLINDLKSIELSRKRSGIIQNISARGVRLQAEELDERWIEGLYSGMVKLGLEIKLPGGQKPIRALAKVAWLTKTPQQTETGKTNYLIGLEFIDITTEDRDIIKKYIISSYLEEKVE
jgi:c-di-GMP-binding flagellar brake protein YcgR